MKKRRIDLTYEDKKVICNKYIDSCSYSTLCPLLDDFGCELNISSEELKNRHGKDSLNEEIELPEVKG